MAQAVGIFEGGGDAKDIYHGAVGPDAAGGGDRGDRGDRGTEFEEKWVYLSTNLLFERNADAVIGVIGHAREAGVTHIIINDYQSGLMADMPPHYFANVARVKKAAGDARIALCPSVFPIGSSGRYLYSNPNLADGIPVRNMRFVVRGGAAEVDPSLVFRHA